MSDATGEQAHLSIGEVLSLVQEDFPDITISKIRFLESQGLLDPERTPSGYRKFYDADIERLQWILTQQRDHFLPLKVIRERLAEWDATGTPPAGDHQSPPADQLPGTDQGGADLDDGPADDVAEAAGAGEPAPLVIEAEPVDDVRRAAASLAASSAIEVTPPAPQEPPDPEAPAEDEAAEAAPEPAGSALGRAPDDSSLTAEELASRAGVGVEAVRELEGFSMISSRRVGPETYYDADQLPVVEACRAFLDHGVEVRHLRMYKIAAEREAGVLEQLIMPLLKQRNPEAKARAVDTVTELADAGESLHAALLRRSLRETLP
jgi:DNA-binding transcriptional MerR regulator